MLAMLIRFCAFLLAATVLAPPSDAQSVWKNITYTPPPGWTASGQADLLAFIKTVDGRKSAVIFVFAPRANASPASLVIQNAAQVAGSGTLEPSDLREAITSQGWRVTHGKGRNDAKGADIDVVSAVITSGTTQIPVVLADFDNDGSNTEDKELGAFIASLKLTGAGATPLAGKGGLEGFFVSINMTPQVMSLGGVGLGIGAKEMQLFKEGRMVLASPAAAGDADAYCRTRPTECGFYSSTGAQFVRMRPRTTNEENLRFMGEDERAPLKRSANGDLDIGGELWRKVLPFSSKTLNGDFTASGSGTSVGADGSTQSAYGETHYRFRNDGRVWRGGYGAFVSNSGDSLPDVRVGTTMAGQKKVKTGTHTVGAYSVTLKWDDGTSETLPMYQTSGVLVLDGDLYSPKK
jgi:hypothetical protein